MQKLVTGVHRFQSGISTPQRELFQRLADGQRPDALFITCSDSRINPNLITQTEPGELFIIRNAGDVVPPYGAAWLQHVEATRWISRQKYTDLADEAKLNVTTQENVLVQMENLRTHPAVAAGLAGGTLRLHGWVYKIETGQVFSFDQECGQFVPLTEVPPAPVPPPVRLTAANSI